MPKPPFFKFSRQFSYWLIVLLALLGYQLWTMITRQPKDVYVIRNNSTAELTISMANICKAASSNTGTYFSAWGRWDFSGDIAELKCEPGPRIDAVSIFSLGSSKRLFLSPGSHCEFQKEVGRFSFCRSIVSGVYSIKFIGNDGSDVFVSYSQTSPWHYEINRRIGEHFETIINVTRQDQTQSIESDLDNIALQEKKLINLLVKSTSQ